MSFGKDVFISYAHLDNQGVSPGWINRFHASLKRILDTRLGREAEIWRDDRLRGNDDFSAEIFSQFPNTALLVSVVTPRYVVSKWCLDEAGKFCEVAQQPPGLVIDNKCRAFKVILTPPESQDPLPGPMRDTLGFDFYIRSKDGSVESKDENDPVFELDACYGSELEKKFNATVARLAWDIAKTLQRVEHATAAAPAAKPAEPTAKPTVYLAECAYDRRKDREALCTELQMRGYPVVPDRALPQDEAECRAEVARLLEHSALSIHLVGSAYGAVPDGPSRQSVVAIQNELAVQRARGARLRRVVSLPAGTRSDDPQQQAFIDTMHGGADAQFGADLITANLEAVKSAIRSALASIEAPPAAPQPGEEASAGAPTIYVIFDERDRKATVPLRKTLKDRGITVQTPVFGEDDGAAEVRRAKEERLAQCDAALVYYGSGTEAWKASIDSELRKAGALRAGRPLPVFTWLAEPATDAKADAIEMAEPNLIDGQHGFSDNLVDPIVQALAGIRRG